METKDLAKNLKDLRATRGMSQEYLAEESRVSLRTIQRIENTESEPTGETLKRIAFALDVELTALIGANAPMETNSINATIIFLKKRCSKTNETSEVKTFKKFIDLLQQLKEKNLSSEQMEEIESYIQYLALEKIPSFNNVIFKQKLIKLKKQLKNKLHFVPTNYYTIWTTSFGLSFAIAFTLQENIDDGIKIGVISVALLIIGIGVSLDKKMKRLGRSFNF